MKASKKSTSSQAESSEAETSHPFINGWARVSLNSTIKHGVLWPTELGESGPALCGTTNAPGDGWLDPPDVDPGFFCNPCVIELSKMYRADDPKLTPADRQAYRSIMRMS